MKKPPPSNDSPPPRKFSVDEIKFLARQAGELEALSIKQANEQIEAKIIDRPAIPEPTAALLVTHAEERARMEMAHSNEQISLAEIHAAARTTLLRKQKNELELISSQKSGEPGKILPQENSSG